MYCSDVPQMRYFIEEVMKSQTSLLKVTVCQEIKVNDFQLVSSVHKFFFSVYFISP